MGHCYWPEDLPEPTRTVEDDADVGIQPSADLRISLMLILSTLAACRRVFAYGFMGFDAPSYVYNNLPLREGNISRNLQWVSLF